MTTVSRQPAGQAERLSEKVLAHASTLPEGVPVTAKGLLHLGSRAAVDQALSRLTRRGALLRAAAASCASRASRTAACWWTRRGTSCRCRRSSTWWTRGLSPYPTLLRM